MGLRYAFVALILLVPVLPVAAADTSYCRHPFQNSSICFETVAGQTDEGSCEYSEEYHRRSWDSDTWAQWGLWNTSVNLWRACEFNPGGSCNDGSSRYGYQLVIDARNPVAPLYLLAFFGSKDCRGGGGSGDYTSFGLWAGVLVLWVPGPSESVPAYVPDPARDLLLP